MFWRRFPTLFIVALTFFLAGCRSMKAPEFRYLENLRVQNLGLDRTSLGMDLRFRNPNHSRVILKKAEGDAWLDNSYLGHFSLDTTVSIPAKKEFVLPLNMNLDMGQFLKNSLILLGNKEVRIRVDAKARIGRSGIFINYPFKYEGKQQVKRLVR